MDEDRDSTLDQTEQPTSHWLVWCEVTSGRAPHPYEGLHVRAVSRSLWAACLGRAGVQAAKITEPWDVDTWANTVAGDKWENIRHILWFPRGQLDLVLSGFAGLIDRGTWRVRPAVLSGASLILRGRIGRAQVDATSLAVWTGGPWMEWEKPALAVLEESRRLRKRDGLKPLPAPQSPLEAIALGSVLMAVAGAADVARAPCRLSAASQARAAWQSWLGPRNPVARPLAQEEGGPAVCGVSEETLPVLTHARASRVAARHCAYQLVREQYYSGHHSAPVYVYDLQAAYLRGLLFQPLPCMSLGIRQAPRVQDVRAWSQRDFCAALVRVEGARGPWPGRTDYRQARLTGNFATWLCGAELEAALRAKLVAEVLQCALFAKREFWPDPETRSALLAGPDHPVSTAWHKPYWRSLYSALVGQWAAWFRRWERCPLDHSPVGPWGSWERFDVDGQWHSYRAVGGRVERQLCTDTAPWAYPALFAAVTSWVRRRLDELREVLPSGSVIATVCDSLWLTQEGVAALRGHCEMGELFAAALRCKQRWDEVWLDGRGRAVGRIGGQLYAQLAGIPGSLAADDTGNVPWTAIAPEGVQPDGLKSGGVIMHARGWDAKRFVEKWTKPLRSSDPWTPCDEAVIREELLRPLPPPEQRRGRAVADE